VDTVTVSKLTATYSSTLTSQIKYEISKNAMMVIDSEITDRSLVNTGDISPEIA